MINSLPASKVEGSTQKYLLYAIGEITLVVIGILIALQINNWNQSRIDRKSEMRVLKSVADEANNFRWQIERGQRTFRGVVLASDSLLKLINAHNPEYHPDSLDQILDQLTSRWLFGKSNENTIYDALTGSGELGLIQSEDLREEIYNIKREMLLLANYEDIQVQYVDNHLLPVLNQYLDGVSVTSIRENIFTDRYGYDPMRMNLSVDKGKFGTDYELMMKDKEFSNILLQHMRRSATLLPIYRRLSAKLMLVDSVLHSVNPEWIEE